MLPIHAFSNLQHLLLLLSGFGLSLLLRLSSRLRKLCSRSRTVRFVHHHVAETMVGLLGTVIEGGIRISGLGLR